MLYREADHEASEDNDDGLVDMDDDEDKDESSFDERLGGSSATLLRTPPLPWWDSLLLLLLLVKQLLLAKVLEVLKLRTAPLEGAVDEELLRIRARSSVNLA